jgi:hypothetical protein
LNNVGYTESDEIISKDISYIISKQSENGSWGSVDITSAGIQALKSFLNSSSEILKAENYLNSFDGNFGNSFSTSWVLQVLENNINGEKYLINKQQSDGGVGEITDQIENRIWATSYAIPGILHKPWAEIMQEFSKPEKFDPSVPTKGRDSSPSQGSKIQIQTPEVTRANLRPLPKESLSEDKEGVNNLPASVVNAAPQNFFKSIRNTIFNFINNIIDWFIINLKL